MTTTLFTNAHIATGEPGSTAASTLPLQDILVTDGVFTAFGPGLAQQYEAQGGDLAAIEVVALGGKLVCPPFCDTHLHLDYVFTARKPGAVNESGTLFEGIQRWSETKSDLTVDELSLIHILTRTTSCGPSSAKPPTPSSTPVSYTHLDVYKRQHLHR